MYKGTIYCSCGQLFGFSTEAVTICCPACHKEYDTTQYEKEDASSSEGGEEDAT